MIARLPSLHYLDYRLITAEERDAAFTDHRADVEKLKRQEEQLQEQKREQEEMQSYREKIRNAGLKRLYNLWPTISEDDEDRERLMKVPDMENMWNSYHERVTKIIDDCIKEMMKVEEKMTEEKEEIDGALDLTKERTDLKMQKKIDEFNREKKHTSNYVMHDETPEDEIMGSLEKLKEKNKSMKTELLEEENSLHESREAMLSVFESSFADLAVQRLELANKMFRAVEKEEQNFRDDCKSHLLNLVDRLAEGQSLIVSQGVYKPEDLEAETRSLLQDREGAVATVGSSHDFRMSRVLKQEDLVCEPFQ